VIVVNAIPTRATLTLAEIEIVSTEVTPPIDDPMQHLVERGSMLVG
jgi:hypothetical protein